MADKETEYGLKIYTKGDMIFCLIRIMFGLYFCQLNHLIIPCILLSVLFFCKVVSLVYIVIFDKLVSKYLRNIAKHYYILERIDLINKRIAFITVVLPHLIQFFLCYYISLFIGLSIVGTEYKLLLWIIVIPVILINTIFFVSALSIFAKEGFTHSMSKCITIDTTKSYWGEGIVIIFWSVLYFFIAVYLSYNIGLDYIQNTFDYVSLCAMLFFICSIVQTIKCLNIPDVFTQTVGNVRFYNCITFIETLSKIRCMYLKSQSLKIGLFGFFISISILGVGYIAILINGIEPISLDFMISIICAEIISLTSALFILRRMCIVPLFKGLFDEIDETIYYYEYIDVTDFFTYKYLR